MLHINNILVFVEAYRCDREIYGLFILKPQVVKVEICHNLISDGLASYRSLRSNKLRIIFAYRQTYCFRRLRSEVKFELLLHIYCKMLQCPLKKHNRKNYSNNLLQMWYGETVPVSVPRLSRNENCFVFQGHT